MIGCVNNTSSKQYSPLKPKQKVSQYHPRARETSRTARSGPNIRIIHNFSSRKVKVLFPTTPNLTSTDIYPVKDVCPLCKKKKL